jgi:hypothetical protein
LFDHDRVADPPFAISSFQLTPWALPSLA